MAADTILLSSSPATGASIIDTRLGTNLGVRSSSPDLPSLQELVAPKPNQIGRAPEVHGRSTHNGRARPLDGKGDASASGTTMAPATATTTNAAASSSTIMGTTARQSPPNETIWIEEIADISVTSIDISALDQSTPERRPGSSKLDQADVSKTSRSKNAKQKVLGQGQKPGGPENAPPSQSHQLDADPDAPFNIPAAMSRRVQWTPPPKDTVRELGSQSSDIVELLSSASKPARAETTNARAIFQKLNETYGYDEEVEDRSAAPEPPRLEGVLKKRKLLELVPTTTTATTTTSTTIGPEAPAKSPTKKAPKKKARTITELATAAYMPKEDVVEVEDVEAPPAAAAATKAKPRGKGAAATNPKAAAPKRKSRAKKKQVPEIILLSPGAALQHVADQQFVFGTTSQLARDQNDARGSNGNSLPRFRRVSLTDDEYVTPINSDAIEPPEAGRPRLWDAAARDVDGELLHTEIIDLIDSPLAGSTADDIDPFGYVNLDARTSQSGLDSAGFQVASSQQATTSLGLSSRVVKASGDKASGPSQSKPTASAPTGSFGPSSWPISSNSPPPSSQKRLPRFYELEGASAETALAMANPYAASSPTKAPEPAVPKCPNFELLTDVQLARQVAGYGFKPIKKRVGMISLLTQCWESKHQPQLDLGARTLSTAASAATATTAVSTGTGTDRGSAEASAAVDDSLSMPPPPPKVAEPVKRPRGRPRKNMVPVLNSDDSDDGPVSSQIPESEPPKKPRGRPRKTTTGAPATTAAAKKSATASASKSKASTTTTAAASTAKQTKAAKGKQPATPPKKKAAAVLEIPDSDSDMVSSPERIFSSPAAAAAYDVSLPTEDDSHLSLATSPTEQEAALFRHITQAVMTAERTQDPQNPSWHEKILMYEPIILEDLAAWLNTGPLSRVGCDAEVSPAEVKRWCESKSVCCLWRQRMNGLDRKRL